MTLAALAIGAKFRVKRVLVAGEIGQRLAEMGFTAEVEGRLVRKALLGDPLHVEILRYQLTLRKSEAAGIEVEILPPKEPV